MGKSDLRNRKLRFVKMFLKEKITKFCEKIKKNRFFQKTKVNIIYVFGNHPHADLGTFIIESGAEIALFPGEHVNQPAVLRLPLDPDNLSFIDPYVPAAQKIRALLGHNHFRITSHKHLGIILRCKLHDEKAQVHYSAKLWTCQERTDGEKDDGEKNDDE